MKKKGKFYKCENCSMSYVSHSAFKTHQQGCVQGVYHECEICDFQTYSLHVLDGHMDTHVLGNRWFCLKCKDNDILFHSQGSLRSHACTVHKVQLKNLNFREEPREDYKMETAEECRACTKGKIVRGGDQRLMGMSFM